MHTDMCKPTDDHNVTDHVRKKRDLLHNCGGLRWNLPGNDVCSEFKVTTDIHLAIIEKCMQKPCTTCDNACKKCIY